MSTYTSEHTKRILPKVIGTLLFAALCLVGLDAADAGERLSGEEIRAILSGNSITGRGFTLYYDPSGDVRGVENDVTDTGKWWAKDDRFCVQWNTWMNGRELCMFLKQDGPILYRESTNGNYKEAVELLEGNPKGL